MFNVAGAPSLTLSAGVWLIQGHTALWNSTTSDAAVLRLYDNTAAAAFGGGTNGITPVGVGAALPFSASGILQFTGADRTVYLWANRNGASSISAGSSGPTLASGHLTAVRIA